MKIYENIDSKLHMEFYKEILIMNQDLKKKYYFYPYYYFPRGSILINQEKKNTVLSLPMELEDYKIKNLLRELNILDHNLEFIEGEHYSLKFIEYQIEKTDWECKLIEDEKSFSRNFYLMQINQI